MKKTHNLFVVSMLLFMMTALVSCFSDPCKDVVCDNALGESCFDGECLNPCVFVDCQNGGQCEPGNTRCNCPEGWEGNLCQDASVEKFVGTYTLTDDCGSAGTFSYTMTVIADTNDVIAMYFGNLFDLEGTENAEPYWIRVTLDERRYPTSNARDFTIPIQAVQVIHPNGSQYLQVSGHGDRRDDGSLWFDYNFTFQFNTYQCSARAVPN